MGSIGRFFGVFFSASIPAYFWLGLAYAAFVGLVATFPGWTQFWADQFLAANAREPQLYERVEQMLQQRIFDLPLFSDNIFGVTFNVAFVVFGFICAWVEVVRATNIRSTARNDTWSLIVTLIAFTLFVGVSAFGTTAFLIVAVVGFGDVLLDRYVGQAVARRDFGGMIGPAGGGG